MHKKLRKSIDKHLYFWIFKQKQKAPLCNSVIKKSLCQSLGFLKGQALNHCLYTRAKSENQQNE